MTSKTQAVLRSLKASRKRQLVRSLAGGNRLAAQELNLLLKLSRPESPPLRLYCLGLRNLGAEAWRLLRQGLISRPPRRV